MLFTKIKLIIAGLGAALLGLLLLDRKRAKIKLADTREKLQATEAVRKVEVAVEKGRGELRVAQQERRAVENKAAEKGERNALDNDW